PHRGSRPGPRHRPAHAVCLLRRQLAAPAARGRLPDAALRPPPAHRNCGAAAQWRAARGGRPARPAPRGARRRDRRRRAGDRRRPRGRRPGVSRARAALRGTPHRGRQLDRRQGALVVTDGLTPLTLLLFLGLVLGSIVALGGALVALILKQPLWTRRLLWLEAA